MQVTCEFYATLRDAVGRKRVTLTVETETTVSGLLQTLADAYDGLGPLVLDSEGRVRANVNVLVNDEPVRSLAGLETVLSDGDTLMMAPSVAGG